MAPLAFDIFPILVARAPAATPATFTTIANLDVVSLPELSSNESDSSVQNHTIDQYSVSSLLRRKATPLTLVMLPSDATHDHVSGLYSAKINNTFDGYRFSHAASGLIWVASGQVTAIVPKAAFEGKLALDVTMRFSGPMGMQSNSAGGMITIGA